MAYSLALLALSIFSLVLVYAQLPKDSNGALERYHQDKISLSNPSDTLQADELRILDVVLLASVDGKFHALNRTTGRMLWSMEHPISNPTSDIVPVSELKNLVMTEHEAFMPRSSSELDYDDEEDNLSDETYIIEPQTGTIFVKPSDSRYDTPLQKLPFTISRLVELSPFRFDDRRTFVGKKRTSLITIDLSSGEILGVLDPDKCSPNTRRRKKHFLSKEEELLEELDPPDQERRLVHIGRTDYHVSVYEDERVIQNLTFSSYGPNNLDREIQKLWQKTPDNLYHQPMTDGSVIMFDKSGPIDSIKLKRTVVAVFDAVSMGERSSPLVLLQPSPSLHDLYPTRSNELQELERNPEITFVNRIEDSLFAMSLQSYPLVLFSPPPKRCIKDGGNAEADDYGILTESSLTLQCMVGSHWTEIALPSHFSNLVEEDPLPTPQTTPVPKIEEVQLPMDVPRIESRPSSSSPPVTLGTPDGRTGIRDNHRLTLDPAGRDEKGDYRSPFITAVLGLVVLAWIFAKRLGGRWNSKGWDINSGIVQPPTMTFVEPIVQLPVVPLPNSELKPLPPVPPPEAPDIADEEEVDDPSLGENGEKKSGKKRKPIRRKPRSAKKKNVTIDAPREDDDDVDSPPPATGIILPPSSISDTLPSASSLVVTDVILGYGSHGTIVYKGAFQGRAVAVKRLTHPFFTLASREVALLQEADDHPNVIRYYYKEEMDNFLYIALELCPASLADLIERPHMHTEISATFDPKRALHQITNGLKHLHSLKIVHRDIKPQNILISKPNTPKAGTGRTVPYRMLISDFGLCRKLESDQTSFLPTVGGGLAAGTVGWRAPEILRGEVKLDEPTLDFSSGSSPNVSIGGGGGNGSGNGEGSSRMTRLTKSVDVFALGCLFYYSLTGGEHPYGERFEREMNILRDVKSLDRLDHLGEEGTEAADLIISMLDPDPSKRPDTTMCLIHPYFWTPARRLAFLQDASDRYEVIPRDPKEPRDPQLEALEVNAIHVVGPDWHKKLDKVFDENLGKFRKYDGKSVQDLLRALRNKKHHYQDLPDNVKRSLGVVPEGFLSYFTRRFPRLFLHVYSVVSEDPMLRYDTMFRSYFELSND